MAKAKNNPDNTRGHEATNDPRDGGSLVPGDVLRELLAEQDVLPRKPTRREALELSETKSMDPAARLPEVAKSSPANSKEPSVPKRPPGRPKKKSRQGKGGGPKSEEGKARSSRNATKPSNWWFHPYVVEGFETPEEWDEFHQGFIDYYKPEGLPEEDLVEAIASARFFLRRSKSAETAAINIGVIQVQDRLYIADAYLAEDLENVPQPEEGRLAAHRMAAKVPSTDKFRLNEAHLHRLWRQTVQQLVEMQARRLGHHTGSFYFEHVSTRTQLPPPPPPDGNDESP